MTIFYGSRLNWQQATGNRQRLLPCCLFSDFSRLTYENPESRANLRGFLRQFFARNHFSSQNLFKKSNLPLNFLLIFAKKQ